MGRQPGGSPALLQPAARSLRSPGQVVEAIGIEHQQPRELLQLCPGGGRWRLRPQARAQQQRIQAPLQLIQFAPHHMGEAQPEPLGQRCRQLRLQAAAAAGAGAGQGQGRRPGVAVAAGDHQQPPAPVFARRLLRQRPGRRGQIRRAQAARGAAGQGGQGLRGQAQLQPLQLSHPGQGGVLHQPLLAQPQAVGGGGGGGHLAEGPAAVAAEAGGGIDRHQPPGLPALTLRQQGLQHRAGAAVLAGAEQSIDPQGRRPGIGRLRQLGHPQPAGVAVVPLAQGLEPLERAPDRHGDARQPQLPRHHQPITAVVARPHQHHRSVAIQQGGLVQQQPLRHRQRRLLHQRLHRQSGVEQLLLQPGHGRGVDQQVFSVAGRPGLHGHDGPPRGLGAGG